MEENRMIDIQKAKVSFKKYVNQYDEQDFKIKLKIKHTYQVADNSKRLANQLGLTGEKAELAELIGLLHDIGRFEQITRFHTFSDHKSISHSDLGVELLFEEGRILDYIKDRTYDSIIKKAIKNHGRYQIEEGLTEEEQLYTKIIRDSDKIDIYRVMIEEEKDNLYEGVRFSEETITPKVWQDFLNHKQIAYPDAKTHFDQFVNHMSYLYDMNYFQAIEEIQKRNYLIQMIERFKEPETEEIFCRIQEETMKYMNQRIKSRT